mgnify:FL=1
MDSRITNSEFQNYNISSLPSFSDHFPLKLQLQLNSSELVLRSPRLFTSYKNTNWDHFKQDMGFSSLSIMPPVDRNLQNYEIDQILNEFVAIFNSVHNAHSEKIVLKCGKVPISENIKKYFAIKHRWQKELKKMYHRTGNRLSIEYNLLSKQIQLLKNIIKELVNLEQAKNFNERLKNIKPSSSAFKEVYRILGKRKSPFCQQISYNNTTITNEAEIAELFQSYYSTLLV